MQPWGATCAKQGVGGTQETELVAAGFPCVDVSRAGLRKGLEGKVRCAQPAGRFVLLLAGVLCFVLHAGGCSFVGSERCCLTAPTKCRAPHDYNAQPLLRRPAQGTALVRHVFRLLEQALKDNHGVPWVLLENVRTQHSFPLTQAKHAHTRVACVV